MSPNDPAHRFPVICGPTAGGKTALAVALAQALARAGRPAEVVSADAYLIYKGLDIGTGKPTTEERAGIPHHLIDIVEPTERFSAHDWLRAAEHAIDDIRGRAALPIVVGGTHLYIQSILHGMFEGPPPDEALRDELRAIPAPERRAELERVDPDAAARIHPSDERRTVRALEVFRQTGTPISELQTQWAGAQPDRSDRVLVGLSWETEAINRRINARVRAMVERGLVEEARGLWASGRLGPQAGEALGYKQLVDHFEGRASLEEAIERIKIETRRFAKNQRTWLRRLRAHPGSVWVDAPSSPPEIHAQSLIPHIVRAL
ncbi:MAG: tRNA (adenosine(37)-N6)-dimethylallyltransferase MiaA [Phycisphaerales bacterium JB059]